MNYLLTRGQYSACLLAGLACAVTMGCDSSEVTGAKMETLRIGVLPGENKAALKEQFSPLVEYLQQQLAVPCQLLLHDSYEELQSAFEREELDLVWFGGYTFVNAVRSSGAVPLVSRDRDLHFTSYFLVAADESATELVDFRGKRFGFGSRLSTSGHLMPRHFLRDWKMDPEKFFGEVSYSGAHDATAFAVRDGEIDVGVANRVAVEAMLSSGRLADGDVRILKETPPYLDYVWACRVDVPTAFRARLRDAFLNLTTANAAHAEILKRLRADFFVPVHDMDFHELQGVVDTLALAEITP